jgi:hypothetical protein
MFFRFGLEILRVGKNFLKIIRKGYQKKRNFALICLSLAKMKKIFFTDFHARTKFCKKAIFWEKIFGNLLAQRSTHFLNKHKIPLLLIPSALNFERNFFSTLIRDGAIFLEVKRPNKIEPFNIFKMFFYKQILGFQGQTKITWSRVI